MVGVVVMRGLTVAVAVIAVLLAGCSDTTSDGGTSAPGQTEATGEPSAEGTGPETAQPRQSKPSIEIVSAPIGGNVEADGLRQCAELNWLGRSPIPDGTAIRLGSPGLDPDGVFEFDQSSCSGDLRPCSDVEWQSVNFKPCYVGVRQVENGSDDVSLIIPVKATCASQEDCDGLVDGTGGSQIRFTPDTIWTPSASPSGR
jgi:hypothetical protein